MSVPPWGGPTPDDLEPEGWDDGVDDRDDFDDGLEADPSPLMPWQLHQREPWVRQHRELRQAFEAFTVYRDMGASRSLRAVARSGRDEGAMGAHGPSFGTICRWSSRWHWVERCRLWDERQHAILIEEHERGVRSMAQRHAQVGALMVTIGLRRILGRPEQDGLPAVPALDPGDLTALDVVRLVRYGAQIEAGAHLGMAPGEARQVADQAAEVFAAAGMPEGDIDVLREQVRVILAGGAGRVE